MRVRFKKVRVAAPVSILCFPEPENTAVLKVKVVLVKPPFAPESVIVEVFALKVRFVTVVVFHTDALLVPDRLIADAPKVKVRVPVPV